MVEAFIGVFQWWHREERENSYLHDEVGRLMGELTKRDEEVNLCHLEAKSLR